LLGGKRHRVTTPCRAAIGAKEFTHGWQQGHILRGASVTAVLLLAALAALLVLALAIRNEIVQFILFFLIGSLVLTLWKVFVEIPWWGWLLFLAAAAASVIVWRIAGARRSHEE
jgi:hypothetical protein